MSETPTTAHPGWYAVPDDAEGHPLVGYWDGNVWTGDQRRASANRRSPRDIPGRVALILLLAGFVGTILIPLALSALTAQINIPYLVEIGTLIDLAATPAAAVFGIIGLVRGQEGKYQAPLSLAILIIAVIGTVILVLPISLYVTGVWAVPHI